MVRYRMKPSKNQSLSWNKNKFRQQQNHLFLVQILMDLSNFKD